MKLGLSLSMSRVLKSATSLTALQVLAIYGTNAWMWIPGVGTVNGVDAQNWLNSNYTTALAVDQQVGSVTNSGSASAVHLTQATAGNRPYLRQSGGVYSWEFDGTDDRLPLSTSPFATPNDHTLMVGVTPTTAASTKTIFSLRVSSSRIELIHTTGNLFQCDWSGSTSATLTPPTTYVDTPVVVTCGFTANVASMRINGQHSGDLPHVQSALTFTNNYLGATNGGAFANHYKGKVHGCILVKAAITHTEKIVLENFLALLSGLVITPDKARTYFSTASLMAAYMGNYTVTSGAYHMATGNSALYLDINATQAEMYVTSGDTTPYKVLIDSLDFTGFTNATPWTAYNTTTASAGTLKKLMLFTGASDTPHRVLISGENSAAGQQFGETISGNCLALTGDNVSVTPVGTIYYCADPSFPGIITNPRVANATELPAFQTLNNGTVWNTAHVGSIHFRAKFTSMYVFTTNASIEVSVDGGSFQRQELTPIYSFSGSNWRNWRKLSLTGNGNTLQNIILSGTGDVTLRGSGGVITGIMLEGTSVDMQAPSGTRRHVVQVGASQTEGVSANGLIDLHLEQDRLPIYALSAGWAGKTVAEIIVSTTFETWVATLPYKDILLISLGVNDVDDSNFQPNYQTLINKALTAGFNRIICRGLGFPVSTYASKNTKIAAAVTATADVKVVYASIDTWTGIAGVHPDRAEYVLMADQSVRDHSSLYI